MISERSFAHSFDSFWHELLPLLTPRFVSLFNEAYETELRDELGRFLSVLPVGSSVERPDIVAEFAFRLARVSHEKRISIEEIRNQSVIVQSAESEAFQLIQR